MAQPTDLQGTSSPHESAADRGEERRRRIAEAAYYRAQRRGFTPGYEEEDWLEAEREIDAGAEADFHAEDNYFPAPK